MLIVQTLLKLLAGHDEELLLIVPILLGCKRENIEGNFIKKSHAQNIVGLIKDTAYSHIMEVSGLSTRMNNAFVYGN